jgi:hypothetical protein
VPDATGGLARRNNGKVGAMRSEQRPPSIEHLDPLVGTWEIEATHRLMAGVVIRGRATFEWLAGELVMIWRSDYDLPDIPDSISILTCGDAANGSGSADADEPCTMHYVDERSVTRVFRFSAEPGVFRFWRDSPGFSQRFTYTLGSDGDTLSGIVELNQDGSTWVEDLQSTYRRVS